RNARARFRSRLSPVYKTVGKCLAESHQTTCSHQLPSLSSRLLDMAFSGIRPHRCFYPTRYYLASTCSSSAKGKHSTKHSLTSGSLPPLSSGHPCCSLFPTCPTTFTVSSGTAVSLRREQIRSARYHRIT